MDAIPMISGATVSNERGPTEKKGRTPLTQIAELGRKVLSVVARGLGVRRV